MDEIGWVSRAGINARLILQFNSLKLFAGNYYLPTAFEVSFGVVRDYSPLEPGNPEIHNTGGAFYSLGEFVIPEEGRSDFSYAEFGGSGHYMTEQSHTYPAPDETTATIFGQEFPLGCVAGEADLYSYEGAIITLSPFTVTAG